MADFNSIKTRLTEYTSDAEDIKDEIKTLASNKSIAVEGGVDTVSTVLTKIKNGTIKTPTLTKSISSNGTDIDVLNYAKVNVSVQSSADTKLKQLAEGTLTSFNASDYNITKIYQYRCYGFTSLQTVNLTGATDIGDYAFQNCANITSLTLDQNTSNVGAFGCNLSY